MNEIIKITSLVTKFNERSSGKKKTGYITKEK